MIESIKVNKFKISVNALHNLERHFFNPNLLCCIKRVVMPNVPVVDFRVGGGVVGRGEGILEVG